VDEQASRRAIHDAGSQGRPALRLQQRLLLRQRPDRRDALDGPAKRGQSAALLDAGSVMLALTLNGELAAFKPSLLNTPNSRGSRWQHETWAHPVVAGNRIFVKDSETVGLWTFE